MRGLYLETSSVVIGALKTISGENKVFAIADIITNTARGITRSFADLPTPFNFIQAGAIGASGAVQLSKVKGLADGSEFITGNGGSRDDKVNTPLSRGERVVDANNNARLNGVSNSELSSGGGENALGLLGIISDLFTREEIAQRIMNLTAFGNERGLTVTG